MSSHGPEDSTARSGGDSYRPASRSGRIFEAVRRPSAQGDAPVPAADWARELLDLVQALTSGIDKAREEWDAQRKALGEKKSELAAALEGALGDGARLREARAELDAAQEELLRTQGDLDRLRDDYAALADAETDVETLAEELRVVQARLESVARERDELRDLGARLERARRERDELEQSMRDEMRQKDENAEALRRQLDEARNKLQRGERVRDELEHTREKLSRVRAERQELRTERDRLLGSGTDSIELRAQLDALRSRYERLRKDSEQNVVLLCEFRVRVNRLEKERDDALIERKRKVKKILKRVHQALDDAGVPRDGDISFGERIRWLQQRR